MNRGRILAVVAATGLLLAAPALPAAADGLSRFKEVLRQAPHGVLSYERGKPLGDNGFVLEDVTVKPPPEATEGVKTDPIHIDRVAVETFDFASYHRNETPNFAKLRAEGISIDTKSFDAFDLRELTGRDTVRADFQLDYRFDPEHRTMTLNRLELDLRELARIELSLALDGIDPDNRDAADAALLRSASLVFEDRSLLGTALPAAARARGLDPEEIVKLAGAILDNLRPGQGAATTAVLDALALYVGDYARPKGPLRLTLNPPGKVPLAAIAEIKDPEDAIRVLGLVVSYASTRPPSGTREENPAR
ncbi:MAG: hypothetical protein AB7H90_04295 [Alphaproteobacteria bacterium]